MFICNVKINGSKVFKIVMIVISFIVLLLFILGLFRIFGDAKGDIKNHDAIVTTDITEVKESNYTNILKAVHDNLDDYIGCKIHFSGYIYRIYDFNESQFVLARDMVISSDFQTLVVGFLCATKEAKEYPDGTWVEITGEITKGEYHGEIPILKVTDIKVTSKPQDYYVYPPDPGYIPTKGVL